LRLLNIPGDRILTNWILAVLGVAVTMVGYQVGGYYTHEYADGLE
jgi:hypothetical protein